LLVGKLGTTVRLNEESHTIPETGVKSLKFFKDERLEKFIKIMFVFEGKYETISKHVFEAFSNHK
jgi:hypothetical protein